MNGEHVWCSVVVSNELSVLLIVRFMGLTVASRRTDATKTGAHRASAHGRITFEFQRTDDHQPAAASLPQPGEPFSGGRLTSIYLGLP